jgi:predicted NAD/FAD-binding protein
MYPARYLFQFLEHHGMLQITGSPQWYSVVGGSRNYVDRVAALLGDVRAAHAVTDVMRRENGVELRDVTGQITRVDRIVIATHADQALDLLADPSDAEVSTLKQFSYSSNAHRSLNLAERAGCSSVVELQHEGLWPTRRAGRRDVLDEPAAGNSIARHVSRNPERSWAGRRGPRCHGDALRTPDLHARRRPRPVAAERPRHRPHRVCGAYHGWGFHEDGWRSGVAAARHFGVVW